MPHARPIAITMSRIATTAPTLMPRMTLTKIILFHLATGKGIEYIKPHFSLKEMGFFYLRKHRGQGLKLTYGQEKKEKNNR